MTPFRSWTRPKALLACGVGDIPLAPVPNSPRSPWAQAVFQVPQGHSHTTSLPPGVSGIFGVKEAPSPVPPKREPCVPSILGLLSDTGTGLRPRKWGGLAWRGGQLVYPEALSTTFRAGRAAC